MCLHCIAPIANRVDCTAQTVSVGAVPLCRPGTTKHGTPGEERSVQNMSEDVDANTTIQYRARRKPPLATDPLATKNLLEVTDGCGSPLLLLTCALLMTSSQSKAPEQADLYSRKRVDQRVDNWALGVFLYKLLFFDDAFVRADCPPSHACTHARTHARTYGERERD